MPRDASVTKEKSITKAMLGEAVHDVEGLPYPLAATFKADGIRALKLDGIMKSRSLKPIRNAKIAQVLADYLPEGSDGEIMTGTTFQDTTSAVMTEIGSARFDQVFTFYWFDWVQAGYLDEKYTSRVNHIVEYVANNKPPPQLRVLPAVPTIVTNESETLRFEESALSQGYEGLILRKPDSPYKCGRSTTKQAFMLKLKRFVDDEAIVTGFEELMHNDNESFIDERGYMKRSSHLENLRASNKLGSFIVKDKDGITFKVGTGFNDYQRIEYWGKRHTFIGKMVKFKYFPIGIKEAPRHPVFLGFRDLDDIS